MTEFTLDELHAEIGRLYDEENVTLYHAKTPNETLQLLILQTRGYVRTYKSQTVAELPVSLSAELTDAGLQRARELRSNKPE